DWVREAAAAGRRDRVCARVSRGSGQTHRDVGLDRAGHGRARGRRLADARARLAHVSGRADVAVVAGASVGRVRAARSGVARIVGAWVAVIAAQQSAAAGAAGAGVAGGTRIAVVTGGGVGGVHTTRVGPAGVVGADVAVVAARRCAAHTLPAGAGVVRRAGVGIVAGRRVGGVH